jgi:hypothetical protein
MKQNEAKKESKMNMVKQNNAELFIWKHNGNFTAKLTHQERENFSNVGMDLYIVHPRNSFRGVEQIIQFRVKFALQLCAKKIFLCTKTIPGSPWNLTHCYPQKTYMIPNLLLHRVRSFCET